MIPSRRLSVFPKPQRISFEPRGNRDGLDPMRRRSPMTVCIAALCNWNYAPPGMPPDWGVAAVTTTDRMITAGDIEYEPNQLKCCYMTPRVLVLIAGDFPTHSEAISMVQRALIGGGPELDVSFIASLYSDALMAVQTREAARKILTPLGLTLESFTNRQNELGPNQVAELTHQLQKFRGPETATIIVGSDDVRSHIYMIDEQGTLSCQNDVGFAAIGLGAWHAKSVFMSNRYVSKADFAYALGVSYTAKKTAEIAPGVGEATDIHYLNRYGWALLAPDIRHELSEAYNEFNAERQKLIITAIERLRKFRPPPPLPPDTQSGDVPNASDHEGIRGDPEA